jgi:hypothetical protein
VFKALALLHKPAPQEHLVKRKFRVQLRRPTEQSWHDALGVAAWTEGFSVIMPRYPGDFPLRAALALDPSHLIEVEAQPDSRSEVTYKGVPSCLVGMKLVAIKADDFDTMVRWLKGEPLDVQNVAQKEIVSKRMSEDDVLRIMPKQLLTRVLQQLVEKERLAPLEDKVEPLVSYHYYGTRRSGQKTFHRLTINSKVARGDHFVRFSTAFQINAESGEIKIAR